jgi:hypothetical protein
MVAFVEMVNASELLLKRLASYCLVFVLTSTTHLMTLVTKCVSYMLTCILFSYYYHQVNVTGADGKCLHSMRWVLYWNVGFSLVPSLARPELTSLLLSRCWTDTSNQQCRSDFILSKSNILNVFILGFRWGTWIDWIPSFWWWHVLTAGARGMNLLDGATLYSWLGCTTWMPIQSTEECCPGAIGCEVSDEVSGIW